MKKDQFIVPEGMIYLDGNSLGPLPSAAAGRISSMVEDEWGELLIKGWNQAGWMQQPIQLGDRIGKLVGAPSGTVVIGDTLSIKVYQALAAALAMRPDRKVILSDTGNFPTDLYMADGLIKSMDAGHQVQLVEPENVADAIDDKVAVLMLTQVDYKTGRKHDMMALTQKAQEAGAVVIWDLAHSAGAFEVELEQSGCEFAVGCTYKYLNAGPGAPAFIYVRRDLSETIEPALSGWLGHDAPFAFERPYRPGSGIERMRVGTPSVIQMAALEAALDVFDDVSMADIRTRSVALCELFISEVETKCPQLKLASPRQPDIRGSQVSFRYADGYPLLQALIERGVVGDFRSPDIIRFGFAPLYIDEDDVRRAVEILKDILESGEWDQPRFHKRAKVT